MKIINFLNQNNNKYIFSVKNTEKQKKSSCTIILFLVSKKPNVQNKFFINNLTINNFLKNRSKIYWKLYKSLFMSFIFIKYNFFISAFVHGGGFLTQINLINFTIYKILRHLCLTPIVIKKDWRLKERKKIGKKKARKSSQYHKR